MSKLRASPILIRKVREVALAMGIPEDHVMKIKVGVSNQANSSSTGTLGKDASVAFPRYAGVRNMVSRHLTMLSARLLSPLSVIIKDIFHRMQLI
jgi:hypothetical protein